MTISTISCPAFRRGERDEGMKGLDMKWEACEDVHFGLLVKNP